MKLLETYLVFGVILFCILLAECRKIGGSGGSRGHSASRASSSSRIGGGSKPSGGYHQTHTGGGIYHGSHTGGVGYPGAHPGGAAYPSGGGYRAPTGGHTVGGGYPGPQTNWNTGGFKSGYSNPYLNQPRAKSHTVRNALIGAGAGIIAWEAGKHLIRSASTPFMHNGRNYYWGQDYYRPPPGNMGYNSHMCRRSLSTDSAFNDIYIQGGTRPKEIVWSCGYGERCCDMDCCPAGRPGYYWGSAMSSYSVYNIGYIILLVAGLFFTM